MELSSAKQSIVRRLKSAFKPWLFVSVIVCLIILTVYAIRSNQDKTCSVAARLKYDGIESGLDPNGNRFDPEDFKNEEPVRLALEALGQPASVEDVRRVQDAVDIRSDVGNDVLETILENNSIYNEEELAEFHDVKASAYFPSQYQITFRYDEAGFTAQEGVSFLNELLKAYESYFYRKYGYNPSLKQVLSSVSYSDYDYIDSVDILSSYLTSLRSYLSRLNDKDNTRFVSQASGYSFADLLGMIDTLQAEDIQWITSYITSNNITKDRNQLIDYYQYKIEDAERTLAQQDSRLYTLNGLIESYVKTTAVFPVIRDASNSQETLSTAYEFSQPSPMYDRLINDKIACQTELAATQEQIALLSRRMERLQAEDSSGNPELVESRLSAISEQITRLSEYIGETADEFFKTVLMKDAVQIPLEPVVNKFSIGSVARRLFSSLLIAESILFGLYALSALGGVWLPKRKKDVTPETASEETAREKVSK